MSELEVEQLDLSSTGNEDSAEGSESKCKKMGGNLADDGKCDIDINLTTKINIDPSSLGLGKIVAKPCKYHAVSSLSFYVYISPLPNLSQMSYYLFVLMLVGLISTDPYIYSFDTHPLAPLI